MTGRSDLYLERAFSFSGFKIKLFLVVSWCILQVEVLRGCSLQEGKLINGCSRYKGIILDGFSDHFGLSVDYKSKFKYNSWIPEDSAQF